MSTENQSTTAAPAGDAESAAVSEGGEFLTFRLGAEDYGVDILKVQEIRSYDTVTRLPDTPHYIKGVINLRGTIVPVIDLRLKFSLAEAEYTEHTVMIILNVGEKVVGIVVDGVSDVITLDGSQVRPPPEVGQGDDNYITGLGALDDRMLILVDIDQLLISSDLASLAEAA